MNLKREVKRELQEPHNPRNFPNMIQAPQKFSGNLWQGNQHFWFIPKVYHTVVQHRSLTDCFCWKSVSHLTHSVSIWHWHSEISSPGLMTALPLCCLTHMTFKLAKYFVISVLNSLEPGLPTVSNNMPVKKKIKILESNNYFPPGSIFKLETKKTSTQALI